MYRTRYVEMVFNVTDIQSGPVACHYITVADKLFGYRVVIWMELDHMNISDMESDHSEHHPCVPRNGVSVYLLTL